MVGDEAAVGSTEPVQFHDRASIRESVWRRMHGVGRPDTRFVFDFTNFIPDFPGSERFPEALRALSCYPGDGPVFVTPDNCLEGVRAALIEEGRPLLQTIAVAIGFHYVRPGSIPVGQERFAAMLDGAQVLAERVDLDFVRSLGRLNFVVTGACAVNRDTGVRYGKGHGFFDLEWGILSDIGVVDERTPVVICVHDHQLVEADLPPAPFDTAGDWIVTPSRTVEVAHRHANPTGIRWDMLDQHYLDEIEPLRELRSKAGPSTPP
jgi:5-formyltetrahydrofolate cyclo-ligase